MRTLIVALSLGLQLGASLFASDITPEFLQNFPKDAYHKLLNGKDVVGKTIFHWKPDQNLLFFDEDSEMKITLFKKPQDITTRIKTWTNSRLEIQKLNFQMKTAEAEIQMEGERLGDGKFRLKITQAGKSQTKELILQEPTLMSSTIRPYLLMRGLPKEKANFKVAILEPSALTTVPVTFDIVKNKAKSLWKVDLNYLQHQMLSEIKADGSLISEKSDFAGLMIDAVPTTAAEVQKLSLTGTKGDLVELARIPFPELPHSKDLKKLSVKMSGLDLSDFSLNRNRQKRAGDLITVTVEEAPKAGLPAQSLIGQANLETYLQGDAMTAVYDPVIQKQAREIIGSESDLWKRALLIQKFVFGHLEKVPTVSIPNALEVLKTKKGDCNEHSVLYTALARAAGVPTRTVVGLVYSERFNSASGFFYHAWVEVFTGKDWIAMDPTWNQAPADATHIAFVEGGLDQQVQVTSLMGKIKLSLVSLSRI